MTISSLGNVDAAASLTPHRAYPEIAALVHGGRAGVLKLEVAYLERLFVALEQVPDPVGAVALFQVSRELIEAVLRDGNDAAALACLLHGASAMLTGGLAPEGQALLEQLVRDRPRFVAPRRLLAAVLRDRRPEAALRCLSETATGALDSDPAAAGLYLDLLAANNLFGLARTEALALSARAAGPDALLPLMNAERTIADKLAILNAFWLSSGLAPLGVRSDRPVSLLDAVDWRSRTAAAEGPLVSIVISGADMQKSLPLAIESVRAQTHANWELFVVDHASSDSTPDLLRGWAERDRRIRPIFIPAGRPLVEGTNEALRASSGEFLLLHEPFMVSHPDRMRLEVEALGHRDSALACRSRLIEVDVYGRVVPDVNGTFVRTNRDSVMFRRLPVLQELGYFAGEACIGHEYAMRLMAVLGPEVVLASPLPLAIACETPASERIDPDGRHAVGHWLDHQVVQLAKGLPLYVPLEGAARLTKSESEGLPARLRQWHREAGVSSETTVRSVWHVADLKADSQQSSMLLNHALIEQRGGWQPQVWDPSQGPPEKYTWQAKRLCAAGVAIAQGPPGPDSLVFVYGLRPLSGALKAVRHAATWHLQVLVQGLAEMGEAQRILEQAGVRGAVRMANYGLFSNRADRPGDGQWDVALFPGLFGEHEPPSEKQPRIGVSMVGHATSSDDLAFIRQLTEALQAPPVVLVDATDRIRYEATGAQILVANRKMNFWNEFFSKVSILVGWTTPLNRIDLRSAATQALLRTTPTAQLTNLADAAPGVLTFQDRDDLLGFTKDVAQHRDGLAALQQATMVELREHLAERFHLSRLVALDRA
jgi:hypothetical protein